MLRSQNTEQISEAQIKATETREMSTQTLLPHELKIAAEIQNIQSLMSTDMSTDAVKNTINKDWPSRLFGRTKITSHGLASFDKEVMIGIITNSENPIDDTNIKVIASRLPAIKQITPEIMQQKSEILIERTESTKISGITEHDNSSALVHLLYIPESTEDINDKIIEKVRRIKEISTEKNKKRITIGLSPKFEVTQLRKIVECVFYSTNIEINIKVNKNARANHKRKTASSKGGNDIIIVKPGAQGASYAEIIKDMKSKIDPKEIGVNIKKIIKNEQGNVRLVLNENKKGGKEAFLKEIQTKVKSAEEVLLKRKEKAVVIMDLEDDITKEEVIQSISKELQIPTSAIRLNDIKKTVRGLNMVIAHLPIQEAHTVINSKKIVIGWTKCRIREKLDPILCNKCQTYGHSVSACTEKPIKGTRCLKCGTMGHLARECKNEESCFSCNSSGHRANSMVCPKYREMVYALRNDNKKND